MASADSPTPRGLSSGQQLALFFQGGFQFHQKDAVVIPICLFVGILIVYINPYKAIIFGKFYTGINELLSSCRIHKQLRCVSAGRVVADTKPQVNVPAADGGFQFLQNAFHFRFGIPQ